MTVPTLTPDALHWDGIDIGAAGSGVYFGSGVDGLGQAPFRMGFTPRAAGGSWGGLASPGELTISTDVWVDADHTGTRDFSPLRIIRLAMAARLSPWDELPLYWSDLMWDADVCAFVRPSRCEVATDEQGVYGGAPGLDLQWVGGDPTIYSADETSGSFGSPTPVASDEFEAYNAGGLVPWARRAFRVRITAHGTVTNPFVRVDHADGTFESITWAGLTMTSGQVLTQGDDLTSRVQSRVVDYARRCTTEVGGPTKAPRLWQLHPGTAEDYTPPNTITVGCASGLISGFVKTRDTY